MGQGTVARASQAPTRVVSKDDGLHPRPDMHRRHCSLPQIGRDCAVVVERIWQTASVSSAAGDGWPTAG